MEEIILTSELDLKQAQRVALELHLALKAKDITLSLQSLRFCTPAGILFLASELKNIFDYRQFFDLSALNFTYDPSDPGFTYLCHVGFFRFFGHDLGKYPGQARGGESYIPMRTIPRFAIEASKTHVLEPVGSPISKIADDLAIVLTRSQDFKRFKPISYCIREVVRNVFEHSEADGCAMIGQGWKEDQVEIAICDRGIGIRASLARKYDLSGENSLRFAIRPGISRSDTTVETNDPWANSGFGLYVLSQLGSKLGEFSLISGNESIVCANGTVADSNQTYQGTFVCLRLRRPHGENFPQFIKNIVANGETEAKASGLAGRASFSSGSISV